MQQLINLWNALDTQRRLVVGLAAIAVFAGVLMMSRMASQPDMGLLYSGLTPEASGDVIAALEAQGAKYQVRGSAIFVESASRDQLRMTLASEGLPANGSKGYELLDNLSGFGTTSQMFDAAYLRAKEGELARTILANPQIRAARVHIAPAPASPFRRDLPPSASVSLRTSGGIITPQTVDSIRFLVSSAVNGLRPEDVSIIDAENGVLASKNADDNTSLAAQGVAEALRQNVKRLVEARTGAGNAIVEINVEAVQDEEIITERQIDPDSRVAISVETQESNNSSSNRDSGGVTVASNLPDNEGAGGEDSSSSQGSNTREITNYEVSETKREFRRNPGSIKRITVAVLVNEVTRVGEDGTEISEPRNAEELADLDALVKSAIGFDEARGDTVTVRSMGLNTAATPAPISDADWVTSRPFDMMSVAKLGIAATLILGLGMFVVRPILLAAPKTQSSPELLPEPFANTGEPSLVGEISDNGGIPDASMGLPNIAFDPNLVSTDGGGLGAEYNQENDDPVARLKNLIEERQDETIEVLKSWIESPEEQVK